MTENRSKSVLRSCWAMTIAMFLLAVGLFAVFAIRDYRRMEHRFDNLTVERLSKLTYIQFPASSRIVEQAANAGWMGPGFDVFAKVEMDQRDVDAFVASIKASLHSDNYADACTISRTDKLMTTNELDTRSAPEWWRTGPVKKFIAVSYGGQSYLSLLIDLDRPDVAVVFLHKAD